MCQISTTKCVIKKNDLHKKAYTQGFDHVYSEWKKSIIWAIFSYLTLKLVPNAYLKNEKKKIILPSYFQLILFQVYMAQNLPNVFLHFTKGFSLGRKVQPYELVYNWSFLRGQNWIFWHEMRWGGSTIYVIVCL